MTMKKTVCPKVDALGVPLVPYVVSELDWSRRRERVAQNKYPVYLTVEEAAGILRISVRAMQQICQDGKIGSTRAGKRHLIPQESMDEYQKIRR
jgi:excisionase family DNA binding protein